jgi:hypothetical protein
VCNFFRRELLEPRPKPISASPGTGSRESDATGISVRRSHGDRVRERTTGTDCGLAGVPADSEYAAGGVTVTAMAAVCGSRVPEVPVTVTVVGPPVGAELPADNVKVLGVWDKVIQRILRHANATTTMNIYVKTVSSDAAAG